MSLNNQLPVRDDMFVDNLAPRYGGGPPAIRVPDAILVQALTSPIAGIAILLTFFLLAVKFTKEQRLNGVEYALVPTILLLAGLWATALIAVNSTSDTLLTTPISLADLTKIVKTAYAWGVFYHAAKMSTEISVLFMLRNVFPLENRRWRYAWIAILCLTVLTGAVATVVNIGSCTPVAATWDPTVPGKCLDKSMVLYGTVGAVGGVGAIILVFAFFQIIFATASKRYKALHLFYWIFAFLLVILCFPSLLTQITDLTGDRFTQSLLTFYIVSVWEVSVGTFFATIPCIVLAFRKSKDEQQRSAEEGAPDLTESTPQP